MAALIRILPALFLFLLGLPSFATAAAGTPQNVQVSSQVVFGMQSVYPDTIYQYQEPSTTMAQFQGSTIVSIPANSTDTAVSIASLFPASTAPICIGVSEMTNPSLATLSVGLSNGGPRINLASAGFFLFRVNGGTPTFYVDNSDLTNAALLRVFLLGN